MMANLAEIAYFHLDRDISTIPDAAFVAPLSLLICSVLLFRNPRDSIVASGTATDTMRWTCTCYVRISFSKTQVSQTNNATYSSKKGCHKIYTTVPQFRISRVFARIVQDSFERGDSRKSCHFSIVPQ